MAYTAKDQRPPWRFLYLTETKSWKWEGGGGEGEEGGGEKVSPLIHATARGIGKKTISTAMFRNTHGESNAKFQVKFFALGQVNLNTLG